MNKESSVPVDVFYKGRKEYSIIALTGIAGSGCSSFVELIANKDSLLKAARKPDEIPVNYPTEKNSIKQQSIKESDINLSISEFVNQKKYAICYDFLNINYKEYKVVKYTHLLWLYLLLYAYHKGMCSTGNDLSCAVRAVLIDKFRPSSRYDEKLKEASGYSDEKRNTKINSIINNYTHWDELASQVFELKEDWIANSFKSSTEKSKIKNLASFFFENSVFKEFVYYFVNALSSEDYYSSCFYYHRFATIVRSIGNPFEEYDKWYDTNNKEYDYLYIIIRLFVILVDGHNENTGHRRIVVDSIRNPAEALYLRERYSGFYLVAIHDENFKDHLKLKVKSLYEGKGFSDSTVELFFRSILKLNNVEADYEDFENGMFSSPDTNRVIECSDIHIQNKWEEKNESPLLRYLAEQWIRYAALILHPGLVTPTTAERCMAVAYTAKLNSGCLSRQVGAAITNSDGSVRSIGWNEVPHGQVSCSLRTLDGINKNGPCADCSYSDFELRGAEKYKDEKSFNEKIRDDYGPTLFPNSIKSRGLPFSYCFKALHNRYEGVKNQVFTRSLHAEENAIIQMSKYGGEALKDGIIYVTASPCELCSKKLYQIGVRQIVYIDPYPGIARQHIISAGFKQPDLKIFEGAIGSAYFKLYQPFMPYKDELNILTNGEHNLNPSEKLLKKILEKLGVEQKQTYTNEEIEKIVSSLQQK